MLDWYYSCIVGIQQEGITGYRQAALALGSCVLQIAIIADYNIYRIYLLLVYSVHSLSFYA